MDSMTGYAFLEKSTEQFSYSVELKSLNSRYLEIYVNVPKIIKNEENDLHNLLKQRFGRGKLELNIDIFDWVVSKPIAINSDMIKKYYRELRHVHRELGIAEPLRFESVLKLDGISQRDRSAISRTSRGDIYATIGRVVDRALDMRRKEGAAIRKDLAKLVSEIAGHIGAIKNATKNSVKDKKETLRKRIENVAGAKVDDVRLCTEIAILADKLDINEEIIRLKDHIQKFKAMMKAGGQVGKKLDFLAQEMFREVNTIGSKSNNAEIAHMVVDMKNHIEMIREHCRNVV
ncbi:MAG TPA: YicC family protein [Spirochaetota bacterium]|nr:YicC family protein [Spirochaetota bacterium]HPC40604.1 YicC family protein [Spirochaetota bacterium]HPL18197.1 YicC family protein [Spirochaetota bacterium]HQF07888.1 YicC family protein [Spirochaetota bacterium]HQH96447.1 YicC family protein [Spirochaetota bacterium]